MNDASLPPSAPMSTANGSLTPKPDHGEVDASSTHPASLKDVCADIHGRVQSFLDVDTSADNGREEDGVLCRETVRRTQEQTRIALEVIAKALRDYEFEHLSLSYNGGKDCLVLLVLYLSVLHAHFSRHGQDKVWPTRIPSIYAKPPDPFDKVTEFVEESARQYCLDLTHISTNPGPRPSKHQASHSSPPGPSSPSHTRQGSDGTEKEIVTFRDAFAMYLEQNKDVKGIFVGTRRTDPHGGKLSHFDMTDGNWPRFMRVHPVIDWRLDEIWCFLRHPALGEKKGEGLEYCEMYDEGYTSLGGVGDTVRNPKLKIVKEGDGGVGEEVVGWRPAWMMVEDGAERAGRE